MSENDFASVKLYHDKSIKEISGSQSFVTDQLEKNKTTGSQSKDKNGFFRFFNSWGPERFPRLIYAGLTHIRGFIFYLLILFFIMSFFIDFSVIYPKGFESDVFEEWSRRMMYLLFAVGAFTATFFTAVSKLVQKEEEAGRVTGLWTNLVKYTIYPFAAGIVIALVLFGFDINMNVGALFPLFLLFIFLTLNSFFTTIRMAQILIDENYKPQ